MQFAKSIPLAQSFDKTASALEDILKSAAQDVAEPPRASSGTLRFVADTERTLPKCE